MRRAGPAKGGRSLPYILVQAIRKQNDPPKKILIPKSIPALQKSAMKALKMDGPIVSIVDRNGNEIRAIEDVKPGQLLLVDTKVQKKTNVADSKAPSSQASAQESPMLSSESSVDETSPPQDPVPPPQPVEVSEDEYVYEEEEEEEDEPGEIQTLLNEVLPDNGFKSQLDDVLSELTGSCRDFLEDARRLENKQKMHWIKGLLSYAQKCGIHCDPERIMGYDQIKEKAIELVQSHQLATPLGVYSSMNLAITGPKSSGKTTLLSVLLDQFLKYVAGVDEWKNTFVIIINFEDLIPSLADPKSLYLCMSKITVSLLVAQIPTLIPHERLITKYFEKIVAGGYLPLLPKRFVEAPETRAIATAFRNVAESLSSIWNNPKAGAKWIAHTFMLPMLIAQELGFSNILCFGDNVDAVNMTMSVFTPFKDSDEVILGEQVRKALKLTNFAISYKNLYQFQMLMVPDNERSVDLEPVLEYVSVMDIECAVEYEDREIYARIKDDKFKITSMHFGNAPGFAHHWITINRIFDRLDECEKDSEEYEDYFTAALAEVQKAIPIIFESDGHIGDVEEIRRRQCSTC